MLIDNLVKEQFNEINDDHFLTLFVYLQELVDIIKQMEAHNTQLKNIISKNLEDNNGKEAISKQKNYDFSK